MKAKILSLFVMLFALQTVFATAKAENSQTPAGDTRQEIINLSRQKWQWMADKNVDALKQPLSR